MRISIVTAAYRGELMDRVLASIEGQTFTDWEWIVVNDNSDSIREWYKEKKGYLDKFRQKVYFIDLPMGKGRFGLFSRNIGAVLASYKRIVFLDDDNEWKPNHLESLVETEEKTGKVPYCWMHIKGKKPGSTYEKIKKTGFSKQGIDLGCILWRREHFDRYGYFRNDAQVTFDWGHMARVAFGEGLHRFECTKEPTLVFHHKRY